MKDLDKKDLLSGMTCFTKSIKIYVPSTLHDKKIDNSKQVDQTIRIMSQLFGGCTVTENIGSYYSKKLKKIIVENVSVCNSFTSEEVFEKSIHHILKYVKKLKKDMQQESIAIQIDDKFLQTQD